MNYKLSNDDALCISDIMVELCKLELASRNDLREKAGYDKVHSKEAKKKCNCPNCGAPITSYICEYCGTEFEKPMKVLTDEEKRESFADFVREQNLAQTKAAQEWQTQQILNTLNIYGVNTQIANIHDGINTSMYQTCNFRDSMAAYQSQINISPYQGPKVEGDDQTIINKEADKLARCLNIFAISLLALFISSLIYVVLHYLP